jgi:hypothetical protein
MKRLYEIVAELLGLASIALIAYGLHAIYPPATWLFLGVVCGIPYIAGTLRTLQPRQEDRR